MKELPRERLLEKGAQALTSIELLAIVLQTGTKRKNVFLLSKEILEEYSLEKLCSSSVQELLQIKGIGISKATKLVAMKELVKRSETHTKRVQIKNPKDIYEHFKYLASKEQEECYVIHLNTKQHIIKEELIFRGTVNATSMHAREVFKSAIRENALSIILIHNHPSGDPSPSVEDLQVTKELREAGTFLGIQVLDHVIIGKGKYFSFEEQNL